MTYEKIRIEKMNKNAAFSTEKRHFFNPNSSEKALKHLQL
jgi:hypothetical protein